MKASVRQASRNPAYADGLPVKRKVVCIVGTRPEAIKMAPVILALRQCPWAEVVLISTGQHRDLMDDMLELFQIEPDIKFDLMEPSQSLSHLTARVLTSLDQAFLRIEPDMVIAQGDTTSVLAAAMASFHRQIPFLHVEAGLRSFSNADPFPEEFNRTAVSRIAHLHFAPTAGARQNLLDERIPDAAITVTGNTVLDALRIAVPNEAPESGRRLLVVTVHRRENAGQPLANICQAVRMLVERHQDIDVIWPVHPSPAVSNAVFGALGGVDRIQLTPPLPYLAFVGAMKRAYLVLTDSGGVQEEASAIGVPILVLRNRTERTEVVASGAARIVGTDTDAIVRAASDILRGGAVHAAMAGHPSPYGDGYASEMIVAAIERAFVTGDFAR